jgi:hypothetical protein
MQTPTFHLLTTTTIEDLDHTVGDLHYILCVFGIKTRIRDQEFPFSLGWYKD